MSCSEANPSASGKKRGVLVEIGVGSFFAPAAPNSTERVTATALKGGFGSLGRPLEALLGSFLAAAEILPRRAFVSVRLPQGRASSSDRWIHI